MNGAPADLSLTQTATAGPQAAFDQLRALLEQQLELVRQGRLIEAETLCSQTDQLVATIADAGLFAGPGSDDRRQSLLTLYRQICLTLAAQQDEIAGSLRTIHRGKRLRKTYTGHAP